MHSVQLATILMPTKEKNNESLYEPVAVGRYGIRKRSEIYKKDLAKDFTKNKVIRYGSLVIGMGSKQIDIGVLCEKEIYCVSPAYHTFQIDLSMVNPSYLELAFQTCNSYLTKKYMIASARQGKSVDIKGMLSEVIYLPSLAIQNDVVNRVRTIKKEIAQRRQAISCCDEQVKSLFNEWRA